MGWCWIFSISADEEAGSIAMASPGGRADVIGNARGFDRESISSPDCHWVCFVILRARVVASVGASAAEGRKSHAD